MSTERTFSKGLAVASNYDIPSSDSVKTVFSYSSPTLFNDLKFGELKLLEGTGYTSFNLHGLSLSVQVSSNTDLTITMHQSDNDALISDTSFVLASGETTASKSFLTTPKAGLFHNKAYYVKVTQSGTNIVLAEGATISYTLSTV